MYKYFTEDELRCQCCNCNDADMNPDFMAKVVELREVCGFPFVISSAYRCPVHNNNVSSTGFTGPHTTRRAIDIKARGSDAFLLIEKAVGLGFTGIGISQKGSHGNRFIHLDDLPNTSTSPRPWVWSY